jgi:hypothetical protein
LLNLLTIAENLIAAAVYVLPQPHPDIVMQLEVEDQPNILWGSSKRLAPAGISGCLSWNASSYI